MNIVRPIIVIGVPRSGTTIFFSILSSHPDLWSLYGESTGIIEKLFPLERSGWYQGNVLEAKDAMDGGAEILRNEFFKRVVNYQAIFQNLCSTIYKNNVREKLLRKGFQLFISRFIKTSNIRIVEKTPKNCFRIPFLNAVFPDAFFVFLKRDPRTNIGSLMEGWKEAGRYETYNLPGGVEIYGYERKSWNFLLPPGWENYSRKTRLEEVCAFQYKAANQMALAGLSKIPENRQFSFRYEDLVARPEEMIKLVCEATGLTYSGGLKRMTQLMPPVNTSKPLDSHKWRKNEGAVMSVLDSVKDISRSLGYDL